MSESLNDIYKAIGGLTAEVKALRRDIEDAEKRTEVGNQKADAQRAIMHRRVDDLVSEVGGVKSDLVSIQKDVTSAKRVTDDVTRWKEMGMGALAVTGIAAAAVSSALTYWWDTIQAKLFGG